MVSMRPHALSLPDYFIQRKNNFHLPLNLLISCLQFLHIIVYKTRQIDDTDCSDRESPTN